MAIKAILFDLDGVISDTHMLHYHAYRRALEEVYGFNITLELYDSIGSVPTRERTTFLCDNGYLDWDQLKVLELHKLKKEETKSLNSKMITDDKLISLLNKGKTLYDLKYAVASNASDEFVQEVLDRKGIHYFFDSIIGSYSVAKSKPNPMMYLLSMVRLDVAPNECLVIEDSNTGLLAGYKSGAYVYRVNGPEDVNESILDLVGKMK